MLADRKQDQVGHGGAARPDAVEIDDVALSSCVQVSRLVSPEQQIGALRRNPHAVVARRGTIPPAGAAAVAPTQLAAHDAYERQKQLLARRVSHKQHKFAIEQCAQLRFLHVLEMTVWPPPVVTLDTARDPGFFHVSRLQAGSSHAAMVCKMPRAIAVGGASAVGSEAA